MSPVPDPADFASTHRRGQRRLAIAIAVLVLVPLGWFVAREANLASEKRSAQLTPSQRAELSALLDTREALAKARIAQWNQAAQREVFSALAIGTAGCPLKLEPPSQISAAAYVKYATHDSAFGTWTLCILRPEPPTCDRTYAIAPDLAALRAKLEGDEIYRWDLEQAKAAPPDEEPPGVLFVVSNEVRPEAHSTAVGKVTFVPGTLSGRMYLYSEGRFTCAGDVTVKNSKTVDIEYGSFGEAASAQQKQAEYETLVALERDFELHLRFAAAKVLRQIQPP